MASIEHYTMPLPSFEKPTKLLIVASPYYKAISDQLIAGAQAQIEASGASWEVALMPGALEIPSAVATAERLSNFDGYVALGCVIRGETTHYETVCNDSSRALQLLGLQGLCIGNGILTVENMEQAERRADAAGQNKGGGAAAAALHLIEFARKYSAPKKGVGFRSSAEDILLAGNEGDTQIS